MKTVLIQNGYKTGVPERDSQLFECLSHNSEIEFDEFYLLADHDFDAGHLNPTSRVFMSGVPSFADILEISSCVEMEGKWIIFSNSDIKIDRAVLELVWLMQAKDFCCISRHEIDGRVHVNPKSSQDCWVFLGGQRPSSLISQSDFRVGQLGAENRLANNFHAYGWRLYNPCLSVKNIHLDSAPKDYGPSKGTRERRVFGTYTFVLPGDLAQVGSNNETLEHLLYTVSLDIRYEEQMNVSIQNGFSA